MRYLIVAVLLVCACTNRKIETIVIRGSDTEVNLVLQIAEEYMDQHADVSIAVTGGGSGTGIASLINKKTDISNSSRAFKDSEIEMARERGVDVTPLIFAVDALCFIVHDELAIDHLSVAQARDIYTGQITNWAEVGGPDLPISLYGRQGNSGTFTFIQTHVLAADYSSTMKQMNGTSQIIEGLKNDKAGIGYVGIGYVVDREGAVTDGIKILSISTDSTSASISPRLPENIKSGAYPIVRPLYQYVDGIPQGLLRDFLLFELSDRGQEIISANGYYPITPAHRAQNNRILHHE